ncbi:MAG TPA: tryptophan-rich sensory protein, partial [Terriglobales bacterium]|nr:tryptophan-rich sensory protein [Terriglobales bacterium]
MILYFILLGLNVVWSGLFYRMALPGTAFAAVLVQGLVTLAALVVFWNIWILPGALLIPVLVWTAFVALRNLAWWRHGRQLGPLEAQAAPPPGLVA